MSMTSPTLHSPLALGCSSRSIAELTAAHMQTLPLQYPFSIATLGGLVATNAYNPKRLLYGAYGTSSWACVSPFPVGKSRTSGARWSRMWLAMICRNSFSARYGALGVIVETTWKLFALPERDESLLAVFPPWVRGHQPWPTSWARNCCRHKCFCSIRPQPEPSLRKSGRTPRMRVALFLVNCEGMDEAVERQLVDIARLCQGQGASAVHRHAGETQAELRHRLAPLYLCTSRPPTPVTRVLVRLGTVPSRVPDLMGDLAQRLAPYLRRR